MSRGFTLVELVVTFILIAIIAAISVPAFFNEDAFEQRGFFDETVSAVRFAQKRALASGCTVRVNIATGGYALFTAANAASCNNTATCTAGNFGSDVKSPVDTSQQFTGTAPSGVTLSPVTDICFRPSGTTTLGADTPISVGSRQFTVWANTGFVER